MAKELEPGALNIRIAKFYTKQREEVLKEPSMVPFPDGRGGLQMMETIVYKKTGKMIPEDWVSYGPPGAMDRSQTPVSIKELQKVQPPKGEFHPAAQAQYDMAQVILKHYEAWKQGQEVPLDGTPLAAWNALTSDEVEDFRKAGIRTVEEIRDMTESVLTKINVPRMREKKIMAARFLDAADQNKAAADREADRVRITELEEQIAELVKSKKTKAA